MTTNYYNRNYRNVILYGLCLLYAIALLKLSTYNYNFKQIKTIYNCLHKLNLKLLRVLKSSNIVKIFKKNNNNNEFYKTQLLNTCSAVEYVEYNLNWYITFKIRSKVHKVFWSTRKIRYFSRKNLLL